MSAQRDPNRNRTERMTDAIEVYIADKRAAGQINSDRTEDSYRRRLEGHAQDVTNRGPRNTNRDDVMRTLRRWEHPNTQANARAILVSFYRWAVEEGIRKDNPAEQTRRPKKRKPSVYRLRREEVTAIMRAALTVRERRVIYIGLKCQRRRRPESNRRTARRASRRATRMSTTTRRPYEDACDRSALRTA